MSKAKDEIEAKIGIKIQSTDVIIPPNHLSPSLNMAKSQGANMNILVCSLFPFDVSSSLTHASSISIDISPPPPSSKPPSSLPSNDQLISKISILLSSVPCLTKSYSKMGGRRLSSLAEVPLEWLVSLIFRTTLSYQTTPFAVLRRHPRTASRKIQGHHHRAYVRSRRSGNIHTP